ncbi:MAG: NAD(P)/FAD-dependent oxidoreductase [Bacteroidales bacterium]|nr:NAD(P)/FAD-dependent oxidoreductase [Bacteroidales bacterium]
MAKRRLVIIGAGFGGLNVAKTIDKSKYDVRIVDKHNYHSFAPLFYQVASSELEPAGITFPLRREMRRRNVRGCLYDMGTVKSVDTIRKVVVTDLEELPYDVLIIAAGATNNFFGIDGLRDRVYTLKSVPEAISCRNAILERLERAAILPPDSHRRKALLTFAVVGGGPTGVEIAGALGEMKRYVIKREYPRLRTDEVKVILYEGSDRLLRTMSEKSSCDAFNDLGELMVDVRLGKTMQSYKDGRLTFTDGSVIDADTVIWTAGITGSPIELTGTDVKAGPGGRFAVDEYNRVIGLDDVYAIGDIASHSDERYPRGCPQLAQPAIQQGKRLARNLNNPDRRRPFVYNDKGSMATIGRNRAVVDMGKLHFGGWLAWITWMFVHLISLLGMRNKIVVLLNWIWSYFNFSTSMRMILRPSKYPTIFNMNDENKP